jgi:hypothetical protein
MKTALSQTNRDLLHQVSALRETLRTTLVPALLERYRTSVIGICSALEARLAKSLVVLELGVDSVHPDILSATSACCSLFDLVNNQLSAPLIRYHERDLLALTVLDWLHHAHSQTHDKPFGLSSGVFSIYPDPKWPVTYFMPVSSQMAVRYLPLLYHEFAHLLYVLSKPELDDLVADFQQIVRRALAPRAIRDGQPSNDEVRREVQTSWREYWAQEIYCDAVGLTIGGPSFLHAFSHYFRFRSSGEYFRPQQIQLRRRHPVTWLRVQLLATRAERYGLGEAARAVRKEWRDTAELFRVPADFQGTWVDGLAGPMGELLDDMIEETSPFDFRRADDQSPHRMIDGAWQGFLARSDSGYVQAEGDSISEWLSARGYKAKTS